MITIDDQIAEVEREIKLREKTYPRWSSGPKPKLTKAAADRQLARMRAVQQSLYELKRIVAAALP